MDLHPTLMPFLIMHVIYIVCIPFLISSCDDRPGVISSLRDTRSYVSFRLSEAFIFVFENQIGSGIDGSFCPFI